MTAARLGAAPLTLLFACANASCSKSAGTPSADPTPYAEASTDAAADAQPADAGAIDADTADAADVVVPPPALIQDFHLTARPFRRAGLTRDDYLNRVEGVVRAMVKLQDSTGALIDPVRTVEWQYGTPFFAFAVATLIEAGRAGDMLPAATLAMSHSSSQFFQRALPQNHGEFFVYPLAATYVILAPRVDAATAQQWKSDLTVDLGPRLAGNPNNWRTYAMKGEWFRIKAGLVPDETASKTWIESTWTGEQSKAVSQDLFLYHDYSTDPDTWAYEAVAKLNIGSLLAEGYDGVSAKTTMADFVFKGGETTVKLLDPSGQGAANGRSGDHSWNDAVAGNLYERLAEMWHASGDDDRAARYRHAAMLTLSGTARWLRPDGAYSVTKNQFDFPAMVRWAVYSGVTNYNGNMELHQAESYRVHVSDIPEAPTWSEIGGYALQTDDGLAAAVANAGGMHMQIALRGQTVASFGQFWTALGVSRFSRPGWDSRLGPSDGFRDPSSQIGLTFAPTFEDGGAWVRLASIPDRYRGRFSTTFTHPLLVRCAVDYVPIDADAGSQTFHEDFVITPDGILSTTTSTGNANWGLTLPLLVFDGAKNLVSTVAGGIAGVRYPDQTDEQTFIAIGPGTFTTDGSPVRGGYGDLQSIRYEGAPNQIFVYPRTGSEPTATAVRDSFKITQDGFMSVLGRVGAKTYVGATSAGGEADGIDLDADGTADVKFDKVCRFVLQLSGGRVVAVETDRAVACTIQSRAPIALRAFSPVTL
jgi:hypothetical protein